MHRRPQCQPRSPIRPARRPAPAPGEGAPSTIRVEVIDRQRSLRIDRRWLERVIRRAVLGRGTDAAEICVLLVDDRKIAELHGRWLGDPSPTDVLTFDLAEGPGTGLHGDIVVSAETARRTARALGWSSRHELAYYVVHGLLHLAGLDDRTAEDRRRMRAGERRLMAAAGLPAPPRARRPRP